MNSKRLIGVIGLVTLTSILLLNPPLYAQENIDDLKKQIETLQQRVEELEANKSTQQDDDSLGFFNRRNGMWNPFEEMHRMQDEMNRMFQHSFNSRGWSNGGIFSNRLNFDNDFDMKETEEGYRITFEMAGIDKDKLDIEINDYSITVKGEQSHLETNEQKDSYFSAKSFGSFMRTIPVPEDADTSKVKTEKEGDNLVIILPKKVT